MYYVTMQITFPIPEFARKERNLHCDVVHVTTKWALDSFWITRSQRSRRRDKGLLFDGETYFCFFYPLGDDIKPSPLGTATVKLVPVLPPGVGIKPSPLGTVTSS